MYTIQYQKHPHLKPGGPSSFLPACPSACNGLPRIHVTVAQTNTNKMEQAQEVAKTIISQLTHGQRRTNIVMSWGTHAFRHGITPDTKNYFLLFRVQGLIYKGLVMVVLWGDDTYTVRLVKKNPEGWFTTTKEKTGIYCDMLTEVIDAMVEKPNEMSQAQYKEALGKETYNI